jgi:RNA polymerase sigma-70 factor (ECF subfamily)
MSAEAENELISRCRRGDETAWDALFDHYYPMAGRFVYQISPSLNPDDVEEICQEVFLAVIRNLQNFQGHCQFQTWLFRIAANKARDHIDRQHAAKRGGGQIPISLDVEDPETGLKLDPPSKGVAPDHSVISRENALFVHEALAKLGDPCREIIELRYFGDLSYDEIALELRLNAKTVSSRLSKCLDKLEEVARGLLAREGPSRVSVQ